MLKQVLQKLLKKTVRAKNKMILPDPLQNAIADELLLSSTKRLSQAREELSERYRNRSLDKQFMTSEAHRNSYLVSRLPATFAVVHRVLNEIKTQSPNTPINSLLDLGAGPGTAMWAAQEIFSELHQINLIEFDSHLIKIGQRLASKSTISCLEKAKWHQGNLENDLELPKSDIITLSYCIGELKESAWLPLLERCWRATGQFLVIIEPGTPMGFERIRQFRSALLAKGAHLLAPCPHANVCPMSKGDWCHFSARVQRSALHRQIKEGALGHEDEKFSYLIFSKVKHPHCSDRVLRHPIKRSGHILFTLCTESGLNQKTISKKTPEPYKTAKEVNWGDILNRPQDQ
jgi:ribosomal protein RSM22 (predicted rRNA methylase)